MVTENPLACKSFANEAEIIPFPSEDVTPPVTNMYFVLDIVFLIKVQNKYFIRNKTKKNHFIYKQRFVYILKMLF